MGWLLVPVLVLGLGWTATWHHVARALYYRPWAEYEYPKMPPGGWWNRGIGCPSGSSLLESRTDGYERWCADEAGRRHGPSTRWDDAGRRLEDVMWWEGRKHGLALYWEEDGHLHSAGAYHRDNQNGHWVDCIDGELIRAESWHVGGRMGSSFARQDDGTIMMTVYVGEKVAFTEGPLDRFPRRYELCGLIVPGTRTAG